jgi:superfamily I DNA and/or RNA helicase
VSLKALGSGGVASVVFDTVIIDEAARANPLDLMIPMAMASKRIILVGDHRQLPHLLEPDVEEELVEQQKLNEEQREELKESLFERLVKSLRQLQDNNPDQPKRVIMLDTQFRMHQVLGDFISQNFYENHRLPAIKSQRPDSDFVHGVPGYEEKVCAWLDVPASAGVQERGPGGQSRQRRPEARRIAIEAKKIMDNCPQLSVGVITFYSAQRDCIFEELAYLGVAERSANGYVISPEYRALSVGDNIGKERFRVGSVDAFQGKEFDVVLVSLVRTLKPDFRIDRLDYAEKQKALNRAYGFLLLDNRLNVALSRQRSLLIMVGDLEVATHPVTRSAVPALVALEQLCGGVHGTIIR